MKSTMDPTATRSFFGKITTVTSSHSAAAAGASHRADFALAQAALAQRPSAVEELIERLECVPRILAALNHEMSSPLNAHDLEDLSQDTLLVVLNKLHLFQGRARLETWVYRFCYLELMNRVRRENRRNASSLEFETEAPDLRPNASQPQSFERLEKCLEELGPPKSHVIQLRHFEDLTFDEIGRVLGVPANTAKTHYHRGLRWLRSRITGSSFEKEV